MVTQHTRDRDSTRLRILDAAAGIFATRGPEGARVDAIAAAADVNKRMLYHYFQDKQGLFAAVVDHRLRSIVGAGKRGAGRLEFDEVDARLMIWAAARHQLPEEVALDLRRLVESATQAAQTGVVRRDVDTGFMVLVDFAVSLLRALLPGLTGSVLRGDSVTEVSSDLRAQLDKLWQPGALVSRRERAAPRPRVRMMPEVRKR